jgi:hypothetical protein
MFGQNVGPFGHHVLFHFMGEEGCSFTANQVNQKIFSKVILSFALGK